MFMPVGTYGAIKGVTTQQLLQLDCHTILGNTYHRGQRPTTPLIDQMGGLHNFMQVQAAASSPAALHSIGT